MKHKRNRLQVILDILKHHHVGSQQELVSLLATRDIHVTQATLSRDLRTLRVTKIATDDGSFMYIIPNNNELQDSLLMNGQSVPKTAHQYGFISIEFSANIAVIKTRNGYATGLAYDIDMSKLPEILGTIAGADTVFAILREGVSHDEVLKALQRFIETKPIDA